MTYIKSIKATALNRGKPRIWLEHDLSPFGFERGDPVGIYYDDDKITIIAFPVNDYYSVQHKTINRIVAGRRRNGKDIQIFDLTCGTNYQEGLRNGHSKLAVHSLEHGVLIITCDDRSAKT